MAQGSSGGAKKGQGKPAKAQGGAKAASAKPQNPPGQNDAPASSASAKPQNPPRKSSAAKAQGGAGQSWPNPAPLGITEVALRDGHQSLLATRWRTEDMLPMCQALDRVGYWSMECWGGATYDACLRFLGEDPWQRLRAFREALPNTRLQMLLRGQNLLGYRHYSDDVVDAFVRRSVQTGIDVIRIFDALNDVPNLERAIRATKAEGAHAQGTLAYTLSPVHNLEYWVEMGRRLAELQVDSIAIKDMAGLLHPYEAHELVCRLVEETALPIHMQCHATTGLSTATAVKAAEAGLANVDTSVSSMSMTYGHSATEAVAAIFAGTPRDPGLDLEPLREVAEQMRALRRRYARFEGTLRGIDARILQAQVPGGMLSNLENQLRQQQALDRFAQVLEEIPRVRADLGMVPLVTPTSQIVGTQSVVNVLAGSRYATLTSEAADILRGAYGATPAPVDEALAQRAIEQEGGRVRGRPADALAPEMDGLGGQFAAACAEKGVTPPSDPDELERQTLSYALFPQVALHYLQHAGDASAFEQAPAQVQALQGGEYDVQVEGHSYRVRVDAAGTAQVQPLGAAAAAPAPAANAAAPSANAGDTVEAPLAGKVLSLDAQPGAQVQEGAPLLTLEAMKMEVKVMAPRPCTLAALEVSQGQEVTAGQVVARIH